MEPRILDSDHALLQGLAASTGKSHEEIIHEALEAYHRDRKLAENNVAFAAGKGDDQACREEQSEGMASDGAVDVASWAIELFALLPSSTRKGLGYVLDHGTVAQQEELVLVIARAVARARYLVATRQIRDGLEPEALTELGRITDELTSLPPSTNARVDHARTDHGDVHAPTDHGLGHLSSGNVFADLGFEDVAAMLLKADLVIEQDAPIDGRTTLTPDRELEATGALTCYRCGAPARWRSWGDVFIAACVAHAPEDDDA
jgi:hypothetical protein